MSQKALISRLNELPRLQKVLQELLDMVNQDDVDFKQLSNKMSMEQVLSARLLRMANSAYFGGSQSVSSVNDAIIRVGSGPVRTLVVASVLSSAFPKIPTLNLDEYWSDTFEVAVIAGKLGEQSGLDGNEVFTTAILHNIGELMIHTLVPDEAQAIAQRALQGEDVYEVQRELLECTSPELGAILAKTWRFPSEMVDAIQHYPDPSQAEQSQKLATVLHFATDIHKQWDEQQDEKSKAMFIAEHDDARVLHISAAFGETIESVRGNGKELASQMAA
ncbi:HDOD domain-containing protein [Vibrio sp. SCSIO 43136]|uniref:HDOD domain-containing protein n=1 Tax=Vibrio sp. SCSIO 43136 TaxID=2819101 RepID=UPI002074F93B|nr:HDOD domain-containing protein [Vibrio sp. SCSIO 43136]USD64846.1 HDOD domain-containing protein [Vibrio sp. SCSIO 43136]